MSDERTDNDEPRPEEGLAAESAAEDTTAEAAAAESAGVEAGGAEGGAANEQSGEAVEAGEAVGSEAAEAGAEEAAEAEPEEEIEEDEEEEDAGPIGPIEFFEEPEEAPEDLVMQWYILKVATNREDYAITSLKRNIGVTGKEKYFGRMLVPVEYVREYRAGKPRDVKRKLYPGYILIQMALTDETLSIVRETSGVGDFTGAAGRPTPMDPRDVEKILAIIEPPEDTSSKPKTTIPFHVGDRVRVKDGNFENFEGNVDAIDEANGRVTVVINVFNRSTPVELNHWQIEAL